MYNLVVVTNDSKMVHAFKENKANLPIRDAVFLEAKIGFTRYFQNTPVAFFHTILFDFDGISSHEITNLVNEFTSIYQNEPIIISISSSCLHRQIQSLTECLYPEIHLAKPIPPATLNILFRKPLSFTQERETKQLSPESKLIKKVVEELKPLLLQNWFGPVELECVSHDAANRMNEDWVRILVTEPFQLEGMHLCIYLNSIEDHSSGKGWSDRVKEHLAQLNLNAQFPSKLLTDTQIPNGGLWFKRGPFCLYLCANATHSCPEQARAS
jgi:hypothetical protein